MLSSIHPFGERSRNSRWGLTVPAYVVGSVAGGVVTGGLFGGLGQLTLAGLGATPALLALGSAAAVAAAVDGGLVEMRPPGPHRQVNERWLMAYRGWVYGVGFGFQLGLGLATIVTTMTVWLTWLAALLSGSTMIGVVIGGVFGLARALVILVGRSIESPEALRHLHRRIADEAADVRRMTTATAALTAVTALTMAALQ